MSDEKAAGGPDLSQAAVLMMALGADEAAEVLKHLSPKEVQNIGHAMAQLNNVSREHVESVLGSFIDLVSD